jgi:hypothetical protein
MGVVGSVVGGFTLGMATCYAYGIGLYLGLPVGMLAGIWIGTRMAPRDVAIVFVSAAATVWPAVWFGNSQGWDGFFTTLLALAVYSLTALILAVSIDRLFDKKARYWLAVVLSSTFTVLAFGVFIWSIYR